jgi:hypothetical protein
MKRIRHRLGRWLLRDVPRPEVQIVVDDAIAGDIEKALLRLRRRRGGGSLGLS